MRFFTCAALAALALSGCQLPERLPMPPIDQAPNLDVKSFIPANNGVFTGGLGSIPGAICIPNAHELCDAEHIYPVQYLKNGAKVTVVAGADAAPIYDGLIDSKYTFSASTPFLSPSANAEQLEEIKAYRTEKATITPGPDDGGANGFPGAASVLSSLQKERNITLKAGSVIYWIMAAQLISVTEDDYAQVPDMYEVIGVGFGGADATYNASHPTKQSVWLGIQAVKIEIVLGTVPGVADKQGRPVTELMAGAPTPLQTQIFDIDETGKLRSGTTVK